jgi:hypothetical protein
VKIKSCYVYVSNEKEIFCADYTLYVPEGEQHLQQIFSEGYLAYELLAWKVHRALISAKLEPFMKS